jgi:transcriptional regulator with XRE-family HTH domain
MATVAEQLKVAIEQSGKTRYRISQECGISESVLSRFVRGERELTVASVERLCAALGLEFVLAMKKTKSTKNKQPKKGGKT